MINPRPAPSMWQLKPWWCQPWSIVLTGLIIPIGAWFLTHQIWITAPIGAVILAWWILFLYLVPKAYAEATRSDTPPG